VFPTGALTVYSGEMNSSLGLVWTLLTAFGVPPQDPAAWHRAAIVVDTHADTTQAMAYGGADLARPQPELQLDLARAAAGGLDAQFFSIFALPPRSRPDQYFAEATRQIDAVEALARANPGRFRIARSVADVRANAAAGVMSGLLGVEGGHALLPGNHQAQLEHLRALAARGVRYLTLTWVNSNDLGGSSGDKGDIRGLTPFGVEVIKEMNRLGVVVDVSHVSDATFWDAVRASSKPVLASHSSSRALTNIARNMTDAMLKAVAAQGGAVCVNFGSGFLDEAFHAKEEPIFAKPHQGDLAEAWRRIRADGAALTPRVSLDRLVDHITHVARVAGVEHTCLGSDFDGVPATPTGMEDVSKLPALTAALHARGLSFPDIEKILGGNVLRVLEANEAR
jgi:membrane dipeptidase